MAISRDEKNVTILQIPPWQTIEEAFFELLGPPPPRVRYALGTVIAVASIVAIAKTARHIPIPWECIGLAGFGAVASAIADRIRNDPGAYILLAGASAFALELSARFYPATIRDGWAVGAQLGALFALPAVVVWFALDYFAPASKPEAEATPASR